MKTRILYNTLCGAILLLAGCTKEQDMQMGSPEATLSLSISPRVIGTGESEVTHVRVASFVPSTASSNGGSLDVNGGMRELPKGEITQTLRTGVRDIHVIANEQAASGLSDNLNRMRSLADLAAIQLSYEPSTLAPPFVCLYSTPTPIDIKKDVPAEVDAAVVRTVSKVVLTIGYKWGASEPLSQEIVIDRVVVKNLPKYSYLTGRTYDGINFVDSKEITGTDLDNTLTPGTNQYVSSPLTIYIPEFMGATADKGKHAYVEIVGHLKSDATTTCTYRIPLGDDMESNGTVNDYTITRNTAFTIDATIESLGENIAIDATVADWSTVNSSEEVGEYLKLDTEKIIIKHKEHAKVNVITSLASDKFDVEVSNTTNINIAKNEFGIDLSAQFTDFNAERIYRSIGTLTVTSKLNKSLSKSIEVYYEPIAWADFDIVLGSDNTYKIGTAATHKDVLLFNGGGRLGARADAFPHPVGWSTSTTYYTPNTNSKIGAATASGKTYAEFLPLSRNTGDPCASVNDANKWRTPTEAEVRLALGGEKEGRVVTNVYGTEVRGWLFTSEFNLFITWDVSSTMTMSFIWTDGSPHLDMRNGYRWSSTLAVSGEYWSILCFPKPPDYNTIVKTAVQKENQDFMLPVRCVRDYTDDKK